MSHNRERQPITETAPDRKSHNLLRRAKQGAAILTMAGVMTGCAGGVDASPTASTKPEVTTSAPVGAETAKAKVYSSESDKVYAGYLDKLSSAQKAVRENLTPDSLAEMSDTQVTEAFTIRASEVANKGVINPQLYSEAFAARSSAILMAGCSKKEYAEIVRTSVNIPKDAAEHALATKYNKLASPALYGHKAGDLKANEDVIYRCDMIQDLRLNGIKPLPDNYLVQATLTDKPIDAFVHTDGTVDIKITTRLMDNYNTAIMHQQIDTNTPTTDRLDVNTITGLHIDASGAVIPDTIVLN